jgi:Protein of unknown function (DUF2905)
MGNIGRTLLVAGVLIAVLGALLLFGERIGLGRIGLGRLPGDIHFQRRGVEVWIPITSSIVVSLVLSAVLVLIRWLRR